MPDTIQPKHTPGPWKLIEETPLGPTPFNDTTQVIIGGDPLIPSFIATMQPGHDVDDASNAANARLIAAAPDMFLVLTRLDGLLDNIAHAWVEEGRHPDEINALCDLTRDTLAKATKGWTP